MPPFQGWTKAWFHRQVKTWPQHQPVIHLQRSSAPGRLLAWLRGPLLCCPSVQHLHLPGQLPPLPRQVLILRELLSHLLLADLPFSICLLTEQLLPDRLNSTRASLVAHLPFLRYTFAQTCWLRLVCTPVRPISVHVPSVAQVTHSLWAGCWATPTCTTTRMPPFPSVSLWSHAGFCCIYSCITALSFGELIALIFVLFLFYFMVLGLTANLISMSMYFYWILLNTIFLLLFSPFLLGIFMVLWRMWVLLGWVIHRKFV